MPDEVKAKLQSRKEAVEAEFNTLKQERENLVAQGKQLQTRLNEIDGTLVRLQGAFGEINSLLEEPKAVPVEKEKKK